MNDHGPAWASYLACAETTLAELAAAEGDAIARAGELIAAAITAGHLVHAFGTGHSGLLAAEMFYRAGGLAAVNPIFHDDLMLHRSASSSTDAERDPGRGASVFETSGMSSGDVLVVASNSGGNAVVVDVARRAATAGVSVVAIVSRRHTAAEGATRAAEQLTTYADVVVDNHVPVGDAAVTVGDDIRMGPLSTITGSAIVHAIAIAAAECVARDGTAPDVFTSSNVSGGDEFNARLIERFRGRVRAL